MDSEINSELKPYNQQNRVQLQALAQKLQQWGIVRFHFGNDWISDEARYGEYAVVEFADGHSEVWDAPDQLLLPDTWMELPVGAYTFEVQTAEMQHDLQGGVLEVLEEQVYQSYHTPERREALEAEAVWETRRVEWEERLEEGFYAQHLSSLQALAKPLEKRGVKQLFFGVDVEGGHKRISPYAVLEYGDWLSERILRTEVLEHLPDGLQQGPWLDLPEAGPFVFVPFGATIEPDRQGGVVACGSKWTRAYHTQQQREQLERMAASEQP